MGPGAEVLEHRCLGDENGDGPGDEKGRDQTGNDVLTGIVLEHEKGLAQGTVDLRRRPGYVVGAQKENYHPEENCTFFHDPYPFQPDSIVGMIIPPCPSTAADRLTIHRGKPLQEIQHNDSERVAFSEYHGHGTPSSSFMVRKGDWKYIHYLDAPVQLFDLKSDPNELTNLAEARVDIRNEMEHELRKICTPERENERTETFICGQLKAVESWKNGEIEFPD